MVARLGVMVGDQAKFCQMHMRLRMSLRGRKFLNGLEFLMSVFDCQLRVAHRESRVA